jgi:hypothetical protein
VLARLINADADGARIVPAFLAAIAETRDRAIETLRAGLETETPRLCDKSAKQCRNRGSGDKVIGESYDTVAYPPTKCNFQNRPLDILLRTAI